MEATYSEEELQKRLELLKRPFDDDQIEKLPKYCGKKDQNGRVPKNAYGNCPECGKRHPLHLKLIADNPPQVLDNICRIDVWHR